MTVRREFRRGRPPLWRLFIFARGLRLVAVPGRVGSRDGRAQKSGPDRRGPGRRAAGGPARIRKTSSREMERPLVVVGAEA